MKFLAKRATSAVASGGFEYGLHGHNEGLRAALLADQSGFCAYTEKRVDLHDTLCVEHLDRHLKGGAADGPTNWYCTLQSANQRKRAKEGLYNPSPAGRAKFLETRFFQTEGGFAARIAFLATENVYEARDPADDEARGLIDFLGVNDHEAFEMRRRHVERLLDLFELAGWTDADRVEFLGSHPEELSYPTALEGKLGLELTVLFEWR